MNAEDEIDGEEDEDGEDDDDDDQSSQQADYFEPYFMSNMVGKGAFLALLIISKESLFARSRIFFFFLITPEILGG